MSEIKHRDRILEAIDQLRRRKARPDAQRICNFILRRFSISSNETRADLEKCVENDIVLKVEYKGSISYRNAAKKYAQLRHFTPIDKQASRKFSALLSNVITEIVVQEPDYLELGVPEAELIRSILSKDNVRYTRKYVSLLIAKEVENGGLIKMENGHYSLGNAKTDVQKSYDSDNCSNSSKEKNPNYMIQVKPRKKPGPKPTSKNDYGNLRVGGRRKRAKKVFDPSDNNIPKKRGRPALNKSKNEHHQNTSKSSDNDSSRPESRSSNYGRDQGGVCSVCHTQNRKNDKMVACRECSNKAHLSCLNGEENMMLRMNPDNTWQCPHCKMCVICYETSDAGYLAVCAICADAYHAKCHEPRITEKIKSGTRWICINCQMPEQLAVNEIQANIGHNDIKINHEFKDETPTPSVSGNTTPVNYNMSSPSSPVPPALSPQTNMKQETPSPEPEMRGNEDSQSVKELDLDDAIDPSIPDASNWTYDDVYNYFAQYFPEEAKVFKEQEIDGHSLLLMKRMDVLTSLKLKLGPALKIYRHVLKLQVRRNDPKLYWL